MVGVGLCVANERGLVLASSKKEVGVKQSGSRENSEGFGGTQFCIEGKGGDLSSEVRGRNKRSRMRY